MRSPKWFWLALVVLAFCLIPMLAIAQSAGGVTLTEPGQEDWGVEAIMGIITAAIGAVATMYARWKQIPANLPTSVRIARMLDLSQIFDSTRRLEDPDPNDTPPSAP